MTTEIAIQCRQAELDLGQLTLLLPSLRSDTGARERAGQLLKRLSEPADGAWLMARIAALLSPYYERDVPDGVRRMEAEDWAVALEEYPQWCVEKAVRWWKSADNPYRRKRPFEGDIAERCKVEMTELRVARKYLSRPADRPRPARIEPRAEDRCSPEAARRILREAGFRLKWAD